MEEEEIQTSKTNIQELKTEKQLHNPRTNETISNVDINQLIRAKVENYRKQYTFTLEYSKTIAEILKLFITTFYDKIGNTIAEKKAELKFFKDISYVYFVFSEQINKINCLFYEHMDTPKIFDDTLKPMLKKTQITLSKTFNDLSNNLKSKIITNGPLSKVDGICTKILHIQKEFNKLIAKIEKRNKKLKKSYKGKYEDLFNTIVPSNEGKKTKNTYSFEEIQDFIIIELDLLKMINKLLVKINLFIFQMKEYFSQINLNMIEYCKITREAALIYLNESKKAYIPELLDQFEQIKKSYEEINKPEYDFTFKIEKIFYNEQSKKKINSLLTQLKKNLRDYGFVNDENINNDDKFNINHYANIEMFLEMLISFSPKPFEINYDSFVNEIMDVKRSSGLFGNWKECKLITSKQNHIIIIDEPIETENIKKVFQLNKTTIKQKEDKKHSFMFEIIAHKKTKVMNFTGTFTYNAINEECFNNIINKYETKNEEEGEHKSKNKKGKESNRDNNKE